MTKTRPATAALPPMWCRGIGLLAMLLAMPACGESESGTASADAGIDGTAGSNDGGGARAGTGGTSSGGSSTGGTSTGGASTGGTATGGTSSGGSSSGGEAGSGVGNAGGEGGNGGGDQIGECSSDQQCRTRDKLCHPLLRKCTDCVFDSDCPGEDAVCAAGSCEGSKCVNTLACDRPLVCVNSKCEECGADADCQDSDVRCVNNICVPDCSSDNDCRDVHMLCDKQEGSCVQCIQHDDCREDKHCDGNRCVPDMCLGGATFCDKNQLVECSEVGDEVVSRTDCGNRRCVELDGVADCS